MAYSPRPWSMQRCRDDDIRIKDGDGNWIGTARIWEPEFRDLIDAEANATLMAAAPDLLALVEQVEWIDGKCPWCLHPQWNGHAPYCDRQAALAKVYGKPSP